MDLKIPQARVLLALKDGAALTRSALSEKAGYTAVSGTVTRALHGLREGSSSGAAHPGLLALGLIRQVELELDGGVTETCFVITDSGREELEVRDMVEDDMPRKEKAGCINKRYKGN